jgi:putative aldouronate transport system substrate-binding protein
VLVNWGVKDVNYTVDGSGKRTMKPSEITAQKSDSNYRQKTGVGLYSYWTSGAGVKDSNGQYFNPFLAPEIEASGYTAIEKETIAAYNPSALTWANLYPAPQTSEWGFAWKLTLPSDSEGAVAETKINDEIRGKAFYNMITAASDDAFNSQWDSFAAACDKAGIAKREAEITSALKTRMELWYGTK